MRLLASRACMPRPLCKRVAHWPPSPSPLCPLCSHRLFYLYVHIESQGLDKSRRSALDQIRLYVAVAGVQCKITRHQKGYADDAQLNMHVIYMKWSPNCSEQNLQELQHGQGMIMHSRQDAECLMPIPNIALFTWVH